MSPEVLVPAALAAFAVTAVMSPDESRLPSGFRTNRRGPARAALADRPSGSAAASGAPAALSSRSSPGGPPQSAPSPTPASCRAGLGTGTAAVGGGVALALLVGSALGVVLGAVVVPLAWRWLSRLEPAADRRRREQLDAGLPLVVDLMAACLRSGQAPESALTAVSASLEPGPLRAETAAVVARLRLGGDPASIWRTVGRHPQLGPLGRTVARALEGGAAVSDAMDDLAQELRRTRRAEVQARARSVGARAAAPLGLCLLPAFVLVGIVPVVAGSLGTLLQR